MKKIVKNSFILFILFFLIGCSSFLNNENYIESSKNVSFNFRAVSEMNGGNLTVIATSEGKEIDKIVQKNLKANDSYLVSFEDMPIGKVVEFSATITDVFGDVLYEGKNSIKIESGQNNIQLPLSFMLKPRYVLWNNQADDNQAPDSEPTNLEVGYRIFVSEPNAGADIGGVGFSSDNSPYIGQGIADFHIDGKQNIWVLNSIRTEQGKEYASIIKYPYKENAQGVAEEIKSIPPSENEFESRTYKEILTYFNGTENIILYIVNIFCGGASSTDIQYINESVTKEGCFSLVEPGSQGFSISVSSICTDGNDLYYAVSNGGNDFGFYKLPGFMKKLDFGSGKPQVSGELLLSSESIAGFKTSEWGQSEDQVEITDMRYVNGKIYALLNYHGNLASKGGIISFDVASPSNYKLSFYYESGSIMTEADSNNFLVGPRKFIAIKPKELVIADDGMTEDSSNQKGKNRMVTVNLDDMSKFNSIDFTKITFSSYINSSSNLNYD